MNSWPWYVAGPMIAGVMFLLLYLGGSFGVSSNLRTMCAIGGAGRVSEFFRFNWRAQLWNLVFIIGAVFGGYFASNYFSNNASVEVSAGTVEALDNLGFDAPSEENGYLPAEVFELSSAGGSVPINILLLSIAGFLVGFGTRYAGGCTSGHAISGLSNLQLPSLLAVVGFFIGGLTMVHGLFPLIFK